LQLKQLQGHSQIYIVVVILWWTWCL